MDKLTFRKAKEDEVEDISFLIHQMASFEKMDDEVTFSIDELKDELFRKEAATFLFLELDGKKIGYIVYFFSFSTFKGHRSLYLEDLFIYPEYRKRGFGKESFRKIAQIAEENGCDRVDWVCLDWNRNAQSFYVSLGAKPHKEWLLFRLEKDGIRKLAAKKGE